MTRPSPTRDAVIEMLTAGPKPRSEMEVVIGKTLQSTLHDMHKRRLVHVHAWLRGTGNMRAYRMVYAVGDQPDAPRPERDRLEKFRRYYQTHKERIRVKRRESYPKYAKKIAAAQKRLRARNKMKANPYLQLDATTFRALRKTAKVAT